MAQNVERYMDRNSTVSRRVVRVFVTDPDPDMPLAECILFQGVETLTEQTDSEIFLELNVPELLVKHNERRVAAELKPIKARDLRMMVATLVYV